VRRGENALEGEPKSAAATRANMTSEKWDMVIKCSL
jgi:hypothetical protein